MSEVAKFAPAESDVGQLTAFDLDPLRNRLIGLGRTPSPADVAAAMRAEGRVVSDRSLVQTLGALRHGSSGAGPLESLLREPGVTDVLVNGSEQVYVDLASDEGRLMRFAEDLHQLYIWTRIQYERDRSQDRER